MTHKGRYGAIGGDDGNVARFDEAAIEALLASLPKRRAPGAAPAGPVKAHRRRRSRSASIALLLFLGFAASLLPSALQERLKPGQPMAAGAKPAPMAALGRVQPRLAGAAVDKPDRAKPARPARKALASAPGRSSVIKANHDAAPARAPRPLHRTLIALEEPAAARVQPGCAGGSEAEAILCANDYLAGMHSDLIAAYDHALSVGAPAGLLAHQQGRWLRARARAAHEGPGAVQEVYMSRIAEIETLAMDYERIGHPGWGYQSR